MGTALHAFLEHADFSALAAAKAAGGLEEAILAERQRQVDRQLVAPEIAEKLDVSRIRRFVEGEAFAKDLRSRRGAAGTGFHHGAACRSGCWLRRAQRASGPRESRCWCRASQTLCWCIPDHLELLDYKTDRRKTEADFLRAYRPQLNLYALAIDKRFAPKKVTYKGICSLELGKLIDV